MRITIHSNTDKIHIQMGFIGYSLDFSQLTKTLQTVKTMLIDFNIISKDGHKEFVHFADRTIELLNKMRSFITVEREDYDYESIVIIDVNPETLESVISFEKMPQQDQDMIIKVDVFGIYKLIQEFKELIEEVPEPQLESINNNQDEKS